MSLTVTAREAIRSKDSNLLTQSMRFLKAHYRFFGIMIIVMLVLYPVIILLIVLGGVIGGY
ncbi:MAG: hypothetical protein K9J25_05210 [Bacteroidales bacterium]|nr:hypothetical protein [Bacteroidales bacterium]